MLEKWGLCDNVLLFQVLYSIYQILNYKSGVNMLSSKIKLLREKYAHKQSDLAKKLNVTRSSVNAWEMGISIPSTQNIIEISNLYDVSTDYLFGLERNSTINIEGLSDKEVGAIIEIINCFKMNKW